MGHEMPLVKLLDARRAELGMKWVDVAKELGVDGSVVSRWRTGSIPSGDRLPAIARFLDVDEAVVWRALPASYKVRRRAVATVSGGGDDDRTDELARALDELRQRIDTDVPAALLDVIEELRSLQRRVESIAQATALLETELRSRPVSPPPSQRKRPPTPPT